MALDSRMQAAVSLNRFGCSAATRQFIRAQSGMPNLYRMYKAGQATIVHAVASPYRERSHFDGQERSPAAIPAGSNARWLV